MTKRPFKLKSGNTPLFKKMGATPAKDMKTGSYAHKFEEDSEETPAYLKDFGMGEGTSPYNLEEKESGWKKALKKTGELATAGLTGALDAVYGTGKVKFAKGEEEEEEEDNSGDGKEKSIGGITSNVINK